jgi:hypothetical protein
VAERDLPYEVATHGACRGARETASLALFYASDLSSYMTGTVAEVTGVRGM